MFDALRTVFLKEARDLLRDRRTLFFLFAMPLVLPLLYLVGGSLVALYAVHEARQGLPVALINGDRLPGLLAAFEENRALRLVDPPPDVDQALRNGEQQSLAMTREYDRRRRVIVKGLNEIGLPTFEPKGAFYAFPSIATTGLSDDEFAERLLREERVAVVPGTAFGEGGRGHVRCSYATSLNNIQEALRRMRRFVERVRA